MFELHYAYLTLDLFLFVMWLAMFLTRKDARRQMLTINIACIPLGFTDWFYYDYSRLFYITPFSATIGELELHAAAGHRRMPVVYGLGFPFNSTRLQ